MQLNDDLSEKPAQLLVSSTEVRCTVKKLFSLDVLKIKQLKGYDDLNFYLECCAPSEETVRKYVYKILNKKDSVKVDKIESQRTIMQYLESKGFRVPVPVKNNQDSYFSRQTYGDGEHLVRLMKYVDGNELDNHPPSHQLYYNVGFFTGKLFLHLKGFQNEFLRSHTDIWMLQSVPNIKEFIFAVHDPSRIQLASATVEEFEKGVIPVLDQLESGITHGDLNEFNILVNGLDVTGLIDFGDSCYAPYLFELAICICYMLIHSKDVSVGKHVIRGYLQHRQLTELEKRLIKVCVCSRLCQSLVLGCYSALKDPDNTYISSSQKGGWKVFTSLSKLTSQEVFTLWELN